MVSGLTIVGIVFCMSKLLDNGLATIDEIVDLVLRNDRVKYADAIGTWFR